MGNPPDTRQRQGELLAALDSVRHQLAALPGISGHGVGLSQESFERLRGSRGGPDDVRPDDLVVTVHFVDEEALATGRPEADRLLIGVPHEYGVGRFITLAAHGEVRAR